MCPVEVSVDGGDVGEVVAHLAHALVAAAAKSQPGNGFTLKCTKDEGVASSSFSPILLSLEEPRGVKAKLALFSRSL
jgi:hypothetical protein